MSMASSGARPAGRSDWRDGKRGWVAGAARFLARSVLFAAALPAAAAEAVYTPITEPPCRTVGEARQECPALGGHRLFVVSSQERSWIEVAVPSGALCSTERTIVYQDPLGHFPNIGGARVVEWRRTTEGIPYAIIVRVVAEAAGEPGIRISALYVFRLRPDAMSFAGRTATNEAARRLADDRVSGEEIDCRQAGPQ